MTPFTTSGMTLTTSFELPLTSGLTLPILPVTLLGIILWLCTSILQRWRQESPYRSIDGPEPSSILGYLLDLHNPAGLDWHFRTTEKYGHVAKIKGGLLAREALYISDPAALHSILVKDVNTFRESIEFKGLFGIIHHGDGVASVHGSEHKKQRKVMDPVFSTSRISKLSPLLYDITRQMQSMLINEVSNTPKGTPINVLDSITRLTLELIAQGGMGHSFNSFEKTSQDFINFHWALTSVLPLASGLFLILPYLQTWRKMQPVWLRRFFAAFVAFVPWTTLRNFKLAVDSMWPIYAKIVADKKAAFKEGGAEALDSGVTGGNDLMTVMFKANWEAKEEDQLPDEVLISNIGGLIHGGQETTSTIIARFIDLMTLDPSLQTRMRNEILSARAEKGSDYLDYHELNNLPLMDAFIKEALRIHNPVTFVWRQTMEDTVVPLHFPIRDKFTGKERNELLITKGTAVYLGLSAANRSTAIWGPDAAKFKPQRWLGKADREVTVDNIKLPGAFGNMMSFLGGQRQCPGLKFAIHEMKLILSVLIPTFSFERTDDGINWQLGITIAPFVKGTENDPPNAPVRIQLLNQ